MMFSLPIPRRGVTFLCYSTFFLFSLLCVWKLFFLGVCESWFFNYAFLSIIVSPPALLYMCSSSLFMWCATFTSQMAHAAFRISLDPCKQRQNGLI